VSFEGNTVYLHENCEGGICESYVQKVLGGDISSVMSPDVYMLHPMWKSTLVHRDALLKDVGSGSLRLP
jgi:hypothetical protein